MPFLQYAVLSASCQQLMASLCSSDRVLSLLRGLQSDDPAHLAEVEGWVTSVRSALETINKECIVCMDVMLPWKLGLVQVCGFVHCVWENVAVLVIYFSFHLDIMYIALGITSCVKA